MKQLILDGVLENFKDKEIRLLYERLSLSADKEKRLRVIFEYKTIEAIVF